MTSIEHETIHLDDEDVDKSVEVYLRRYLRLEVSAKSDHEWGDGDTVYARISVKLCLGEEVISESEGSFAVGQR